MAWWLWVGLGLLLLLVVYYEIMRVMRRKLYPKIAVPHRDATQSERELMQLRWKDYSNAVPDTVFLVTGGAGSLGTHLVQALVNANAREVRVFDLQVGSISGVHYLRGDITDVSALREAMQGVDTVFHMASLIDYFGHQDSLLQKVNVQGTKSVLRAAQEAAVKKVVYTSSTAVLTDGLGIQGGDQHHPYPGYQVDAYGRTKAAAERLVLEANGVAGVLTCAIRFHLPFGIGCLINEIYTQYPSNYIVFDFPGHRLASPIACQNVAHAHICAHKTLLPDSPVAGNPYTVGDTKLSYLQMASAQRKHMGLDAPVVKSKWLGLTLCVVCEYLSMLSALWHKLSLGKVPRIKPLVTRSQLSYAYDNHDVDLEPAFRDLHFEPIISFEEANQALGVYYQQRMNALKKPNKQE